MKTRLYQVGIVCIIIYFIMVAIGANELQALQKEETTLHIKVLKLQLGD